MSGLRFSSVVVLLAILGVASPAAWGGAAGEPAAGVGTGGATGIAVTIVDPEDNTVFLDQGDVPVRVEASSALRIITRVEFFEGENKIGEDFTTPFEIVWTNVVAGEYELTARATDDIGASNLSPPVNITVLDGRPFISIFSPTNGMVFLSQGGILIDVDAFDDGEIVKVEFFEGLTLLGEVEEEPYLFFWTNALAGNYELSARAIDDQGQTNVSELVAITVLNAAPEVEITSPTNGMVLPAQGDVMVTVEATDDLGVARVELFEGLSSLGALTNAPYEFVWTNVTVGEYVLSAVATDGEGRTNRSEEVNITVLNAAPSVALVTPRFGETFLAGTEIGLEAEASDEGMVVLVEFFEGTNKLGEATSEPYAFEWTNAVAGRYELTAVATDDLGTNTTSMPVEIQVVNAVITSPTNGSAFFFGTDVTISNAVADGVMITMLDLFDGTNLVERLTNAPYDFLWTNVLAGNYLFTVQAADGMGLITTSAPVSVVVIDRPLLSTDTFRTNSRSGLLEQVVRLSNPTSTDMPAARVLISGIPAGMELVNASGVTNGTPFVQYTQAILADEVVELLLEYYVPSRTLPAVTPTLTVEFAEPIPPPTVVGEEEPVARRLNLVDGTPLVEFRAAADRTYYVQYATNLNMTVWLTSVPAIIGVGNAVQWTDTGPPRTVSPPQSVSMRFYRVIVIP